jgi:hypothetical protein
LLILWPEDGQALPKQVVIVKLINTILRQLCFDGPTYPQSENCTYSSLQLVSVPLWLIKLCNQFTFHYFKSLVYWYLDFSIDPWRTKKFSRLVCILFRRISAKLPGNSLAVAVSLFGWINQSFRRPLICHNPYNSFRSLVWRFSSITWSLEVTKINNTRRLGKKIGPLLYVAVIRPVQLRHIGKATVKLWTSYKSQIHFLLKVSRPALTVLELSSVSSREPLSEVKAEGKVTLLPELPLEARLRVPGPELTPP